MKNSRKSILICLVIGLFLMKRSRQETSKPKPRVFGGVEIVPYSYPSLISFELQLPDTPHIDCQGILIHPSWILTSSWCIEITIVTSVFAARHQRYHLYDNYSVIPNQLRMIDIEKHAHYHPKYDKDTRNNDVALVYVEDPFELNEKVQVAPIATERYPLPDSATIVGWGMYNEWIDVSIVPLEATLLIVNLNECVTRMEAENMTKFVNNRSLCGGSEDGLQNACMGNEGAPFYAKVEGKQILLGTMSKFGCFPTLRRLTVFARTSHYIGWMERTTGLCFEEKENSGIGFFVPYTENSTTVPVNAKMELFSGLSDNICSQFAEYETTGRIPEPVNDRRAANIGWGWFRKINCGNHNITYPMSPDPLKRYCRLRSAHRGQFRSTT